MKILISDLLFQRGNRHVDSIIMDGLAEKNEVFVLRGDADYPFEMENREKITFYENKYSKNSGNAMIYKIQQLLRIFLTAKVAKKIEADVILFSVYDARVLPFGLWSISKKRRIIIIENDNIDLLQNGIYRKCYRMFAKKVHHIVYENYFGEYLARVHDIPLEKIHRVPHSLFYENVGLGKFDKDNVDCIAISYSNDEKFIEEVINYEKKYHFFEKNGIKCRMKSRKSRFSNEYLSVNNEFIPIDEYDSLYDNCKVVIVPFPLEYKYRMSGSVIDAFSHHKRVVATNFELAKQYSKLYGGIIESHEKLEEILNAVKYYCQEKGGENLVFSVYEEEHSKENVKKSMECILENI